MELAERVEMVYVYATQYFSHQLHKKYGQSKWTTQFLIFNIV